MLKRILAAAFVAALASACDSTQSTATSTSGSTHGSTTGHVTSGTNTSGNSTGSSTGASNTTGTTATNGSTESSTTGNTTGTLAGNTTGNSTTGNTTGTLAGNTTTGSNTTGNTTGTLAGNTTTGTNTTGNTTTGTTTTGTTNTSTTGTSSTTGTTTTGTSGTTGVCIQSDIPTVRSSATPLFTEVCLNNVVVVGANNAGNATQDGGTQYNGEYYVVDSSANAIEVFKTKYEAPIDDPTRGDEVNVDGITKALPSDGGPTATIEVAGINLQITAVGPGTIPTPKTVTMADIDHANPNAALIGSYVLVPAGSYTENAHDPGLQFHASNGNTYQDGLSLVSGSNVVWVDTYDVGKGAANKSCIPGDGGMPDLSAGNFKAIFDYGLAPNGTQSALLYFADCADQ